MGPSTLPPSEQSGASRGESAIIKYCNYLGIGCIYNILYIIGLSLECQINKKSIMKFSLFFVYWYKLLVEIKGQLAMYLDKNLYGII